MNCQCGGSTKVLDTRFGTYRRRKCLVCAHIFHTVEQRMDGVPAVPYHVVRHKKPAAPRKPKAASAKFAPKPKIVKPREEKARRAAVRSKIEDLMLERDSYDDYSYLPDA